MGGGGSSPCGSIREATAHGLSNLQFGSMASFTTPSEMHKPLVHTGETANSFISVPGTGEYGAKVHSACKLAIRTMQSE